MGLEVKSLGGDFSQFATQLTNIGMDITSTSATYDLVNGYAPINQLPTIAELPQTMSGEVAVQTDHVRSTYQGIADNEAQTSMFADVARTEFGVDGTGETIGVLSTSVNQYTESIGGVNYTGLAASYQTGDLNPNEPVDVIQDNPATPTDEGRAMLENIHDVAPGASLEFATATISETQFGTNIEALQKAGSNIEVDDVGYFDEPMFQDGIIAQAINTVTAAGVTYFSAAGNEGPDSGYLSTFRPSTTTITGIGTGTFMNFNPNGGTTTELPITTGIANAVITFEYDQPYQMQEPAGSSGCGDVERQYLRHQCRDRRGGCWRRPESEQCCGPSARADYHDTYSGQLLYRHSSCIRFQPRTHRVRGRQRHQRRGQRQHAIRLCRRHVLSQFVWAPNGGKHDRGRCDPLVGAGAVPGSDPAGQRAVQLERAGLDRLQYQRCRPQFARDAKYSRHHRAGWRQHLVLRARPDH